MSNKTRQPKIEKAMPGVQRYADATTNSVVGNNNRVDTVDVTLEDTPTDKITYNVSQEMGISG